MYLGPAEIAPVPAVTVQAAKDMFPKACLAMRMREEPDDGRACSSL